MRPFEVGDLIVTTHYGTGIIIYMSYKGYIECDSFTDDCNRHYFSTTDGVEKFRSESKIKHIRKSRKGAKESRDIVAMLARHYKRARTYEWRIEKRDYHWAEWAMSTHELFNDAKDMLK
jgi:hypothetical protein